MNTKSYVEPSALTIAIAGNKATIVLCENIKQEQVSAKQNKKLQKKDDDTTENIYIFDRYEITVPNRDGLQEDVENNFDKWIEKAKQAEYEKLADEVRSKRDALLAETDKEFALDRINLNIPEKVTASTMLNVFKDILEGLGSVCSGEMAKYRQALRDIPQQEGFPYDVKFPLKPNNQ